MRFKPSEYFVKKEESGIFAIGESQLLKKDERKQFNATFASPENVQFDAQRIKFTNSAGNEQEIDLVTVPMMLTEVGVDKAPTHLRNVPVNASIEHLIEQDDFAGTHGVLGVWKQNVAKNRSYDQFSLRLDAF